MISSSNNEEVKKKAWAIFCSSTMEIPQAISRKGYSFFSDEEKEYAHFDEGEDIRLHQTANIIGLAFDFLEGR